MGKTATSRFLNCFDRILFILAGNNDIHKALMSSKLGWIRPMTSELAAFERLKKFYRLIIGKRRYHIFSAIFHRILFILAGNDDILKSLDEFEIRSDLTTGYSVNCL